MLLLIGFHLDTLTRGINLWTLQMLENHCDAASMHLTMKEHGLLGTLYFLEGKTIVPNEEFLIKNCCATLAILLAFVLPPWRGHPLVLYGIWNGLIHLISCLWFLFHGNSFPYTMTQFSEMYWMQEVALLLMFIVMMGGMTGIIGEKGFRYKLLAVVAVCGYAVGFGAIRYLIYLYLLQEYSVLYMPVCFFTLGPMFDFMYFIMIYSFFMHRMIRFYQEDAGQEVWKCS